MWSIRVRTINPTRKKLPRVFTSFRTPHAQSTPIPQRAKIHKPHPLTHPSSAPLRPSMNTHHTTFPVLPSPSGPRPRPNNLPPPPQPHPPFILAIPAHIPILINIPTLARPRASLFDTPLRRLPRRLLRFLPLLLAEAVEFHFALEEGFGGPGGEGRGRGWGGSGGRVGCWVGEGAGGGVGGLGGEEGGCG